MRVLALMLAVCCVGTLSAQLDKIKKAAKGAGKAAGTAAKQTSQAAKEVKKDATAVAKEVKKDATAAGQVVKKDAQAVGHEAKKGATAVGQGVKKEVNKQPEVQLGKKVVKGAKETGSAFKEGVKEGVKK